MSEAVNPMPSLSFVIGFMALGAVMSPIIAAAAGGCVAAHLVRSRVGRK